MAVKTRLFVLCLSLFVLIALLAACARTPTDPTDSQQPTGPTDTTTHDTTPPPPPPTPVEGSGVKTDFSALTPHGMDAKFSRLHEGSLPELVPSGSYGMLLPYSSAVTVENGTLETVNYGFVTADGVVVTDLIYNVIDPAYVYSAYSNERVPAYQLTIYTGFDTMSYMPTMKHAACALDGSWVTPFDYIRISFSEEVFFCIKDYESFDIDVFDYDGNSVYNVLELPWLGKVSSNAWPSSFTNSREGYIPMPMSDGTYAFVEDKTGQLRETPYAYAQQFSDGLAAVTDVSGMLWGYVDKGFNLVIPFDYSSPGDFVDGIAIVETFPAGMQLIINKRGATLFTASMGDYIHQRYGSADGFIVHDRDSWAPTCYDSDLRNVPIPGDLQTSWDGDTDIMPYVYNAGGGWFASSASDSYGWLSGTWLFRWGQQYYFPDVGNIAVMDGRYLVYALYRDNGFFTGVKMLSGEDVVPPEQSVYIDTVFENGSVVAFVANSDTYTASQVSQYMNFYKLFAADGTLMASGTGKASYNSASGLFAVQDGNSFSYIDMSGKTVIKIPLMSYLFD